MERVPRRRQTCTFTRGSFSVSSQRTIPPLRRQAPEKPDFGSRRAPGLGHDSSCRSPANDGVAFSHGNRHAIGSGEGKGALRHQLQHFVEDELLQLPDIGAQRFAAPFEGAPLAYLLMQAGKRQQSL